MRGKKSVYRRYDESFRRDALALLERTGRSITMVADDLGVPHTTLHSWYTLDMAKKGKVKRVSHPTTASAALRQ